jgi:small subunit ribosomal protein S14
MASKAKIAANLRRRAKVAQYAERRACLKEASRNAGTLAERSAAQVALARLPRDASPVRVRNRDQLDGRPRGYVRKIGVSRVRFRELAHAGLLPGVWKSSW